MLDLSYQIGRLGDLISSADRLRNQVGEEKIHIHDLPKTVCSAFLHRQIEYAKSVQRLIEHSEVASAALIARSMLEGAASFKWVIKSEHVHVRAARWREHIYNESLKVPDKHEERSKGLTNIYEIKREAQRLRNEDRKLKEMRWTIDEQDIVRNAREVIEDLVPHDPEAKEGVYGTYQQLSAFNHWSPHSFSIDATKMREAEWALTEFPTGIALEILELATVSLYSVASYTASYFGIGES